ncbi:MAG: glycosyltransferase [Fibrobacteria bacterium]|nr:glycosyltransferase [Fibrobacteria bacterium]
MKMFLVHCSNASLGGAERSLLAELQTYQENPNSCHFILPARGALSQTLEKRNISYTVIPWPAGLRWFTQHQFWWQWTLLIFGPFYMYSFLRYILRLNRCLVKFDIQGRSVLSSGIKSHCLLLLLAPWFAKNMIFNIRDFIEPIVFRKCLSGLFGFFEIEVVANSKAVGKDYPHPTIKYPYVSLKRNYVNRRKEDGPVIITHVAYFAPYKGQDLFLQYAQKILDEGVNAQFWIVGDVIYPGNRYLKYKAKVLSLIDSLQISDNVKVWGEVDDVQQLLEQSHVLLHCTRDPEPYGRVVMESLLCGCEVMCHKDSGVCEQLKAKDPEELSIPMNIGFEDKYIFVQRL